jgi:hypothetical protein
MNLGDKVLKYCKHVELLYFGKKYLDALSYSFQEF